MKLRHILALAAASLAFALPACSRSEGASASPKTLKLQGAGASFPAPLYGSWIKSYHDAHPNVQIDYQSVGSGSGVKSVIDRTVDFGASDAAMTDQEIAQVSDGVQLLPMTAGSIVLAYNLEGVRGLTLTRAAYAGIFLGTISKWDDPAIVAANPGLKLPHAPINVVVRADSSGTTFVFTRHLSEISKEFAARPGVNKMPDWPTGTRSKGNEGVTAAIKTTPGAIGYVEYGYASSQNMEMAALENKSGKFVQASTASGQAALANITLPESMIAWNSDPAGPDAYPIVTYTWLILYKQYRDPDKLEALRDFVRYSLREGQPTAELLGYIPLPAEVTKKVLAAVENVKLIPQS